MPGDASARRSSQPFNSPLDSALVAPIAPPMHSGFFLAWALCSALFVVTIIPGGFLAVRRYRAMTAAGQGSAKRAQPLGDRYVPPESTALQVPPQCLLPPGPDTGNLTFNLATQYSPRLGAVNGSETLHVLCYYNRSRTTRLRSGQTWFGVASLPFPLCRYVVYGPMRLNAEAAKVDATPRDVILIEQLRFAATSGSTGKDPASSLVVSLRGRGEFTLLRRSVGNLRYFAANLLEWMLENGFSGVHLDWRGFDSPLCSHPGSETTLTTIVEHLRDLAELNRVQLTVALSASTPLAGALVDFYLLEGDRCGGLEDTRFDVLYRWLRQTEAVNVSICWPISAAVETFSKDAKSNRLSFTGLEQRSKVCNLQPSTKSFNECNVGQLPPEQGGRIFRYRATGEVALVAKKYANIWKGLDLRTNPMCVLYSDGDYDDPEGECGTPFPLLGALF